MPGSVCIVPETTRKPGRQPQPARARPKNTANSPGPEAILSSVFPLGQESWRGEALIPFGSLVETEDGKT